MHPEAYPTADALTDLELAVARRADELAGSGPCRTSLNLHCWLEAEQEILGTTIPRSPRLPDRREILADRA